MYKIDKLPSVQEPFLSYQVIYLFKPYFDFPGKSYRTNQNFDARNKREVHNPHIAICSCTKLFNLYFYGYMISRYLDLRLLDGRTDR